MHAIPETNPSGGAKYWTFVCGLFCRLTWEHCLVCQVLFPLRSKHHIRFCSIACEDVHRYHCSTRHQCARVGCSNQVGLVIGKFGHVTRRTKIYCSDACCAEAIVQRSGVRVVWGVDSVAAGRPHIRPDVVQTRLDQIERDKQRYRRPDREVRVLSPSAPRTSSYVVQRSMRELETAVFAARYGQSPYVAGRSTQSEARSTYSGTKGGR